MMWKRMTLLTVYLPILLVDAAPALALSPTGTWYTAANRAQVRIGHCGRRHIVRRHRVVEGSN